MIIDHVITGRARCWELCQQLTSLDHKLLVMEITAAFNSIAEEAAPRPAAIGKKDPRDRQTRAAADRTLLDT